MQSERVTYATDAQTTAVAHPVSVEHATSFAVVSFWQDRTGRTEGSYETEHFATLNDAMDALREIEDGEWPRARAIGMFAARHGLPVGGRLDPAYIARLLRDTRAA